MTMSQELHQLLVATDAEDIIIKLRQMCIEREDRIDGEWGSGNASAAQLGEMIDTELAQRILRVKVRKAPLPGSPQ